MSTVCSDCGKQVCAPTATPNYVGQIVFLEQDRSSVSDPKNYSGYNNGEWLVLNQSPYTLYCVKPTSDVYNARYQQQFSIIGSNRYLVISSTTPSGPVFEETAKTLWYNAHKPERGEKLNWVESVYTEAKEVARKMAAMGRFYLPEAPTTPSASGIKALEARIDALEQRLNRAKSAL